MGKRRIRAYFSLNALRMRSTSTSRWKAEASRLKIFSISNSSFVGFEDVDEDASAGLDIV